MTRTQNELRQRAGTENTQPPRAAKRQVCGPNARKNNKWKNRSFGRLQNRLRTINTLRPIQLFRPMGGEPHHGLLKTHGTNIPAIANLLNTFPSAKNKRRNASLRNRGIRAIQFNSGEQLFSQGHGGNMRIKLRLVNVFYYPNQFFRCVL